MRKYRDEKGSLELIALALLAALIVVLAIPLLVNIGQNTKTALSVVNADMATAVGTAAAQ